MLWINFKRIIKTGFLSFWRNGVVSLSAVLVMSVTLMIISSVVFASALLDHTLDGLKDKVDVNVNMLTDATEDEILNLKTSLENLPEIIAVEYITRNQVLENYQLRHADDQKILAALDELEDNPFGAALNIKAKSPDHYENIQVFLEQNYPTGNQDSIIDTVNYAKKREAIDRLSLIIEAGEQFGTIVTLIFIILSIVITLNTLRLAIFISKDEIRVMNLVGADKGYISGPFMVTGAMYGIVSSIFVLLILYPITYWVGPKIAPIFFDLNLFNYYLNNFGQMFIIIFFSGILIGAVATSLAISRYLRG